MLFRPRSRRRHFKIVRGRWPTRILGFESCNCCCCLSLPKHWYGCCPRATTSRNIPASSGGCRIQLPPSHTRSRSSRWRLPWATWPTAQVPVSVLPLQMPPWGLAPSSASHHSLPSGHPHCISGIAKLRCLAASDLGFLLSSVPKTFSLACLLFASFLALQSYTFSSLLLSRDPSSPARLDCLRMNCIGIPALLAAFHSPSQSFRPQYSSAHRPLLVPLHPAPLSPIWWSSVNRGRRCRSNVIVSSLCITPRTSASSWVRSE